MFDIDMLPAEYGDCLWIEYGDPRNPKRILIDGGTHATYDVLKERIGALPDDQREFELLVITHIDNDHIDGALRLLRNPQTGASYKDVWFNGWKHMPCEPDELGALQSEYVSAIIENDHLPWNKKFNGESVMVPQDGLFTPITLDDGFDIILLSPTAEKLDRLRGKWNDVVTKAGLIPGSTRQALMALERDHRYDADVLGDEDPDIDALAGSPYRKDRSAANGGSIAFIAEYRSRKVLFAGDAHPEVLAESLRSYKHQKGGQTLHLDAFKLSHHGSKANLSPDLLDLIRCDRHLVSTNGKRFHHPDAEAMARILTRCKNKPELVFNYNTPESRVWNSRRLVRKYGHSTRYPIGDDNGIRISI